jgi:hypothetical protein
MFRKHVSHINYGDDFNNSVDKYRKRFNFLSAQKYFAKYGIGLTPAEKDSIGTEFLPSGTEMLFLQRQTARIKGLPYRVGRLAEKSIFKSLLSVLKSNYLQPEQAAAVNVDMALREWAVYGEPHFLFRQQQMRDITRNHGIEHLCKHTQIPYNTLLTDIFGDDLQ